MIGEPLAPSAEKSAVSAISAPGAPPFRVIPAIDLQGGRCVRLLRGDFHTSHEVAGDPVAVARAYRDAGAQLIHVVDLDGAREGRRVNAPLVEAIARAAAPAKVELGGGLRSMEDLREAGRLGVWRFILGSSAVEDSAFVGEAVAAYGGRIAVGVDAKDGLVRTHGWLEGGALADEAFAREMEALGVQTIIYTDIDTDGMLTGPNLKRLRAMRAAVRCALVASGGVQSAEDVMALRDAGMDGAIIGKALYAGHIDLARLLHDMERERNE
ncbi:MAG: 1-(5-phosphoribosyl)-5-[(5-phosphoribosylamino)methylideneamino]imidazole-4-carboxamide isomerase [Oscillospiraceae bacterium]|nr:1-(5-phosphoribosyl)-5-[(5-phosphoribosylamino)methylideneamino]imidazole-4-carboxamide isomerase [Oscillospiraceae bacterium]